MAGSEIRLLVTAPYALDEASSALFRELGAYDIQIEFALPASAQGCEGLAVVAPGTLWARLKGLSDRIAKFKPTHIYVHSPPGTAITNQAALSASKARVFASCLGITPPLQERWREKALLAVSRKALSGVFTDTRADTEHMQRLGFTATQLPLAYDAERFFVQAESQRTRTRDLLRISSPVLAYVGAVTPDHGVHILIAALSQLKEQDWTLLLPNFPAKDRYGHRLMAQIAKHGLREKVVYFDPKSEELADHMNAADLIVAPSLTSAPMHSARLLRAAMGCGRVVIASETPSNAEALGGFGHLVVPADPDALAARLSTLLKQGQNLDLPAARWAKRSCTFAHQAAALFTALPTQAMQKPAKETQETHHVA